MPIRIIVSFILEILTVTYWEMYKMLKLKLYDTEEYTYMVEYMYSLYDGSEQTAT